ncbi:hypothetical protein FGE12_08430 [Aggregicoccus sp. 17bor-14]|nr:fused MFS/spermidine synthase [Simulacricoccus sp. 17bor-14]MRI88196.1 hypothetical protein [Aggregicoccus sp. 17bor-14]
MFLGAFLLFQVQPILAKLILPWFGGAAGVWTACVLFFQVALLLGYLYAHLLVRLLSPRAQAGVHLGLLALSLLTLPIAPSARWQPGDPGQPVLRILLLLAACVGLPYTVLSATSPLLSAWYARRTGDPMPYWLYAVSNAASFCALLGYPVLVEPWVPTHLQALLWSAGYAVFAVVCGLIAWDARRGGEAAPSPPEEHEAAAQAPAGPGRRLLWVALSACTSGLLLAVTAHLTQNVAPIPFLWVVPLALYLLSYVVCFARGARYRPGLMLPLLQAAVLGVAYALGREEDNLSVGLLVPLFCAALLLACLAAHAELARLRPPPTQLTGFYLLTSLGGALGGALVALAAPALLTHEWELPLLLGALTLLLALASALGADSLRARTQVRWASSALVAVGVTVCLAQRMLAPEHSARREARNFYGTLRVMDGFSARVLNHGTITHGEQLLDPLQRRQPTTYYGPDSGVGLALQEAAQRPVARVGVVGLGTGTLAAYGRAGDHYRFYELNPLVVRVAREDFSFLADCPAEVKVVLGDARLSLAREPPQDFDVLAIDAFSSDAIPVHLLTREAFLLYRRHLAPGGVLAVHVSNRHLELTPVVALAAREVGLRAAVVDAEDDPDETLHRYGSTWVLLSARDGLFVSPPFQGRVTKPKPPLERRAWTDDYSNLLQVVQWGGRDK